MKPSAACLTAALGCFLFALSIIVGSGISEGLSMAQRVMTDLAMPVGLAWLIAGAGTIFHWRRGNRSAVCGFSLGFLAIWVLFSPWLSALAMTALETPPISPAPTSARGPVYFAVVVLGGGAKRNAAGQVELAGAGERLALAARMWHAGKVEAIICTGSAKSRPPSSSAEAILFDPDDPAEIGREILVALAIPPDRIYRCPGENTAAEMHHLSVFFNKPPAELPSGQKRGLITSAFHLPRAMRLAHAAGIDFEPLPADSHGPTRNDRGIGILVPTAGAGEVLAIVAKEWLARLLGR